jgi:two-component system cell cycle sensor histidine kinase PleC
MRAYKSPAGSQGSRLAEYGARMGEILVRRRAELEARAARVEAEMAIKARSEFLANMNHELRTPLNAIIGFATMLRDSEDYDLGPEQRRTYAEYVLQSADLLLGHINTLLEVAALDSGRVEISDGPIDLRALLDETVERAKVRAAAAGVAIDRRDDNLDVVGWGDAERFSQAADHLLQASIKLSAEGGRVFIRASRLDNGWVEIAVRDEGEGFTNEELFDALDAFKELHRGLDRSFMGPGIGYAVAKTFVEMQGGRFTIESRKGQGTLARIALPPAEAMTGPQEDIEDGDTDEKAAEKKYGAA